MRAIHTIWSMPMLRGRHFSGAEQPGASGHPAAEVSLQIPKYSLLLLILSVLRWKQLNGPIALYTDSPFAEYFDHLGLLSLWDDYNVEVLDSINLSLVNPTLFWSAGKFYAYRKEQAPFVSIDTDLVVWRDLSAFWKGDLRFSHWEIADRTYYGVKAKLLRGFGYSFNPSWRWRPFRAANTSLLYFGQDDFKAHYADEALRYIEGNHPVTHFAQPVRPEMLFAEQRLILLCARDKRIHLAPILDATYCPRRDRFVDADSLYGSWDYCSLYWQPLMTHAWIYKSYLERDYEARREYCEQLMALLYAEFPQHREVVKNIAESSGEAALVLTQGTGKRPPYVPVTTFS